VPQLVGSHSDLYIRNVLDSQPGGIVIEMDIPRLSKAGCPSDQTLDREGGAVINEPRSAPCFVELTNHQKIVFSSVGAVYDRAFFLESTKYGRS